MINSSYQDISNIPEIEAFNLWVENDTEDIGHSSQSALEQESKNMKKYTTLRTRVHAFKNELHLIQQQMNLALVEREMLLAKLQNTKKRTASPITFRSKMEFKQKAPIRINGVSHRCGSYTKMMEQLSSSHFFCH